ncbi:MAG TPA: VC0807 family protein [Opitutaceae bacterium]|nr:VC0807 family protein [Opitutaceae bacterium]
MASEFNPAVTAARPKPENLLVNLVCNVAIPVAILSWLSGPRWLGPRWGLLVALAFPLGYGLYDFIVRRRWNFISIIGFASVLISGSFGLLKLGGRWFAAKDAAIPAIIGLAVLASTRAKTPLVNELLYNPQVIDIERVDSALAARGTQAGFSGLMRQSTGLLSLAFFVSAALNYGLARHLLTSPPGTEAFNGQLAEMHWLSLLVIMLPSMAMMMLVLWRLLHGIRALTGLALDDIFRAPPEKRTG